MGKETNGKAPVGEAPATAAPAVEAVEEIISQSVIDAIKVASGNLGGDIVGGGSILEAADAIKENGNRKPFFDPSLSQYKENLVLYFDPVHSIVREVPVGTGTATSIVCTVPAGIKQADGSVVFNKTFNAYVGTFRKTINVANETGEPVLDDKRNPVVIDGGTNAIWQEMQACKDEPAVLRKLNGRAFCCTKILRDFGPSNYVGEVGNRRPTGHRLTSLPLFEEYSV